MPNSISLDFFKTPAECYYHIYRINHSAAAEVLHYHNFYQVCYVSQGDIIHRQEHDAVHLVHGDAFIIPPGFIHSIDFTNPNAEIYSLSFQDNLFHPGFSRSNVYNFMTALNIDASAETRVGIRLKVTLDEKQRLTLKSLLDCLLRESVSECPKELSASASLIAAILCIMSQAYFAQPQFRTKLHDIEEYSESIERCIRYIDQNFTEALTLGELSRRFALSRSTFSLMFPKIAGMPLKRYVTEKRIDQAVALARIPTLSFNDIANMVGYDDFSTFYRNFSKIMGISPSQFRKNMHVYDNPAPPADSKERHKKETDSNAAP